MHLKKLLIPILLSGLTSCVTVRDPASSNPTVCSVDFFANLESKIERREYFDVLDKKIEVPTKYLNNILIIKEEGRAFVVTNGVYCQKNPNACKVNKQIMLDDLMMSQVAQGYVFRSDIPNRRFIANTFKEASECFKKTGDKSTALIFEKQATRL